MTLLVEQIKSEINGPIYNEMMASVQNDPAATITKVGTQWRTDNVLANLTPEQVILQFVRLSSFWAYNALITSDVKPTSEQFGAFLELHVPRVEAYVSNRIANSDGQTRLSPIIDWLMSDYINSGLSKFRFMTVARQYLMRDCSISTVIFQMTPHIKDMITKHYHSWIHLKFDGDTRSCREYLGGMTRLNRDALRLLEINVNTPEYVYVKECTDNLRIVSDVCNGDVPMDISGYPLRGVRLNYLNFSHIDADCAANDIAMNLSSIMGYAVLTNLICRSAAISRCHILDNSLFITSIHAIVEQVIKTADTLTDASTILTILGLASTSYATLSKLTVEMHGTDITAHQVARVDVMEYVKCIAKAVVNGETLSKMLAVKTLGGLAAKENIQTDSAE